MDGIIDDGINRRIQKIRDEFYKGKNAVMSEATGLARTTLNNILGSSQSIPGYETLIKLASLDSPRINAEWLLTGKGEMLRDEENDRAQSLSTKPHIDDVAAIAGFRGGAADSVTWDTVIYKPVIIGMPEYDLTMRVSGNSMYPYLCSGDLIALREVRSRYFKPGEIYVVSTDEDAFVKRVFRSEAEGMAIRCESINPDFPPFDLPADSILRMYRVVGLQRVM